jgi:hypothetical protein
MCQIVRPLVGVCVRTVTRWPSGPNVTHVIHVTNMGPEGNGTILNMNNGTILNMSEHGPISTVFRAWRVSTGENFTTFARNYHVCINFLLFNATETQAAVRRRKAARVQEKQG